MTNPSTDRPSTLSPSAVFVADNVRHELGDVTELAASIDRVGLLNPLTVRLVSIVDEDGEDDYGVRVELVAGHRRLAAVKALGWDEVPVVWVAAAGDEAAYRTAVQLVENLQRSDLTPIEEAEGLRSLVELLGSQSAAADAIGRSKGHVSKRLKLLELTDRARQAVEEGAVTLEQAFELAKVDDPKRIDEVVTKLTGGLAPGTANAHLADAVRQTERDRASRKAASAAAKANPDVEVVALADVPKTWRPLAGWNGLAVDFDDHQTEPCHRLAVGIATSWEGSTRADEVVEWHYCAEPARHQPAGDSAVKVAVTVDEVDKATREAERSAERTRLDALNAAREAAAVTLAGDTSDRNAVLKALATFILGTFEGEAFVDEVFRGLGVNVPAPPDKPRWGDEAGRDEWKAWEAQLESYTLGDGVTTAQHYRAALAVALILGPASEYPRPDPWVGKVAELVGYDRDAVTVDEATA